MRYTPQTEDEIKRDMLIPEGEYDFTVHKATDKTSKSGNEMIEIEMTIYCEGHPMTVRDWLMADLPMQKYKILHFCQATGLVDKYHSGELCAMDCERRSGQLRLIIKDDKKGNYGPQNQVKDYIADSVQGPGDDERIERVLAGKSISPQDDIPF